METTETKPRSKRKSGMKAVADPAQAALDRFTRWNRESPVMNALSRCLASLGPKAFCELLKLKVGDFTPVDQKAAAIRGVFPFEVVEAFFDVKEREHEAALATMKNRIDELEATLERRGAHAIAMAPAIVPKGKNWSDAAPKHGENTRREEARDKVRGSWADPGPAKKV